MFKIKQIGNFDRVPVFAAAIIKGDTGEISQKLETGTWCVSDTLKIRDDIEISPLYLAVIMKQLEVIKLLAENGADVNDNRSFTFIRGSPLL